MIWEPLAWIGNQKIFLISGIRWRFKSICRQFFWCSNWNFGILFGQWRWKKPERNSSGSEAIWNILLFGSYKSASWKNMDMPNAKFFNKYRKTSKTIRFLFSFLKKLAIFPFFSFGQDSLETVTWIVPLQSK